MTLLFTDVEESTRLLQELGDGYGDALPARPARTRLEAELPPQQLAAAREAAAAATLEDHERTARRELV
ncbi:MAG TPA: hypothetical protein VFU90_04370 [Candidatus Tumulicola sp.]|nr:hypothetical protein [Candidatus Tumulicola sp.]